MPAATRCRLNLPIEGINLASGRDLKLAFASVPDGKEVATASLGIKTQRSEIDLVDGHDVILSWC